MSTPKFFCPLNEFIIRFVSFFGFVKESYKSPAPIKKTMLAGSRSYFCSTVRMLPHWIVGMGFVRCRVGTNEADDMTCDAANNPDVRTWVEH